MNTRNHAKGHEPCGSFSALAEQLRTVAAIVEALDGKPKSDVFAEAQMITGQLEHVIRCLEKAIE